MDINDLQALIDSGQLQEAIALVEHMRSSCIELQANIEQKLADTRRDISSVDWNIPGEMNSLLKGAMDRIEQSQTAIDVAKDSIKSRIEILEDLHVQNFGTDRPQQDEYYDLRNLYQALDNCYLAHVRLLNPLIGARSVFLDEQMRQSFSFLELQS